MQLRSVLSSEVALHRASVPRAAATQSEQDKDRKYKDMCKDNHVHFQPLAFEVQGAFGAGVLRLITRLCRILVDNKQLVMGDAFNVEEAHAGATKHVQRLSVAVARGSARHAAVLAGVAALHVQAFKTGHLRSSVVQSMWPTQDTADTTTMAAEQVA